MTSAAVPAVAVAPIVVADGDGWLPRWRAGHVRGALVVLCAALLCARRIPAAVQPSLAVQVAALVVAVAVFGVPHGALDALVGRRWLAPQLGRRWWAPFYIGYVLLAAVVVAGWVYVPVVTLAAFLAASAVHFGLGDVDPPGARSGLAWAEILVRGAAPIAVPSLAHADAVRQAFGWVAPGASMPALAVIVAGCAWCARWLVLPGCALFAGAHLRAAAGDGAWHADATATARAVAHRSAAVECLVVPAVAAVLPPLLAFLVYFCLLHSARHALELAAVLDPRRPGRAWTCFVGAALPATAATLALASAAWVGLSRTSRPHTGAAVAVQVLFAGLAALTAPHMLLTAMAGELGRRPAASSGRAQSRGGRRRGRAWYA
ncbi:hypothetical protein tb265_47630 [Gemmatimonadetes bacterium T265]|nr:hypothetical protein tb265_47630 [Gemmatimonadetes bacterium T265]